MAEEPRRDLQDQIDDLARLVSNNKTGVEDLRGRADASEDRADATDGRVTNSEERADATDVRLDHVEARALIDRDMIADLQNDGVLSRQHVDQLEEALRSSRTIGAAIGIIMASRHVTEPAAYQVLRQASQDSNKKVRELAAELVLSTGFLAPEVERSNDPSARGAEPHQ